jgi:integrase/recombinase XerD
MSHLRQAVDDYLAMRRSLGFSLAREGRWLLDFAGHLEQAGSARVTTELAVTWATRTRADVNPAWWNHRLTVVRTFARHLSTLDPATEIPPAGLMPCRYRRVAPYLFTPGQIDALIGAAAALTHPLRALNYTTLIALLAVTGMRVGEACGLDRGDVDTGTGVVTIRAGKLGKAREVPLHLTASQALRAYARRRDQLCPAARTPAFFVNVRGNRLAARRVPEIFAQLCRAAGIGAVPGGRNPRVHDLRH